MNTRKFINRLKRYLSGTADQTEKRLVDEWYNSFPVHTDIFPLYKRGKQQHLFQRIQAGIGQQQSVVRPWRLPIWKAAAVLVLMASMILFWWKAIDEQHHDNTEYITVETGSGIKRITLPDSSTVWLNASGKIRFQRSFSGTSRVVHLDEGEAFFEVRKNPSKPFYVYTPELHTRVLGTSFNIKTYRALKFVKVTVVTGIVQIAGRQQNYGKFAPGQQLTYDLATGTAIRNTQTNSRAEEWKSGKTRLIQAGFDELALAFNNIYHVKLKAGNSAMNKLKYTLTLESAQPLADALLIINAIHETKLRKENNELTLYK